MTQTETPIDLVRRICADHKIKPSLVVSGSRKAGVSQVRTICMLEVKAAFPDIKRSELADLFALSPSSISTAFVRNDVFVFNRVADRKTWANSPENVVAAALRKLELSPEAQSRLFNNGRTGKIVAIRRDLLQVVMAACPGVSTAELMVLFNLPRDTVIYHRRKFNQRNKKTDIKN